MEGMGIMRDRGGSWSGLGTRLGGSRCPDPIPESY